jgi:hypothetical protein
VRSLRTYLAAVGFYAGYYLGWSHNVFVWLAWTASGAQLINSVPPLLGKLEWNEAAAIREAGRHLACKWGGRA